MNKRLKFLLRDILLPIFIFAFLIPGMIVRLTFIPSESMTPTLIVGDKVILSKVHFGPQTPETLLQVPFTEKRYAKKVRLPFFRLPGFSPIKLCDCLVFNYPAEIEDNRDMRTWYVKRTLGMPGQRFKIEAGDIYINGNLLTLPEGVHIQQRHIVTLQGFRYESKEMNYLKSSLGIQEAYATPIPHTYVIHITQELASKLKTYKEVEKIAIYFEKPGMPEGQRRVTYYTYGKNFAECLGGSIDYFPEIIIPAKGMTIEVTRENLAIYGHVILHHEGHQDVVINAEEGTLMINGVQKDTYTFTQDYYMAVGDNRHNSSDSRAWGFVPGNHIVGKPLLILFSNKNRYFLLDLITLQMHWNRFFKVVR